jgi:hypothetical protein
MLSENHIRSAGGDRGVRVAIPEPFSVTLNDQQRAHTRPIAAPLFQSLTADPFHRAPRFLPIARNAPFTSDVFAADQTRIRSWLANKVSERMMQL